MKEHEHAIMKLPISLDLPKEELEELIDKAKDWVLMHGMCLRSKNKFDKNVLQFAPFTLFPSPFPRKEFYNACNIQIILNVLVHRVAHNYDFLKDTLQEIIKVDDFTKNLFSIYETVHKEGIAQKTSLGILRSDLMLATNCPENDKIHECYCCWKQIEINTIASGFGWLGPASTELHKFVLQELGYTNELQNLPENNALQTLCSGFIDAWNFYGDSQAVILFVVEDVTYNICDQRFHEYEIRRQNPDIKIIRRNLTQLAATARLGSNMELIVNNYVVAVVYYRSGYEPGQYPTQKEWDVRLLVERSLAIKCPSIQYHLAGTKKVQQTLAKSDIIVRFLNDEKTAGEVKKVFTGLYPLDFDEYGDAAVEMGISNPHRFVLKPQREGGCNNLYGSDIKNFLESMKFEKNRVAWILMDRIYPPVHKNYIVKYENENMNLEMKELVSELGIFGVIIGDDKNIMVNKQAGHMLRTKLSTDNEGGVASGLAIHDVIHAVAKYEVGHEPREIFFFREGSIVMWNISDLECGNLLQFLRSYEHNRYMEEIVHTESELMNYSYADAGKKSHLKDGDINLAQEAGKLDKYTFSNAMAQSVKLGIWEASLNRYVDSIDFVTEDLKFGKKIQMSQHEVLRKQGELFALRHRINLTSDLLDTPDFYWERDDLESLYQRTCGYFSIAKRTKVMNERLNHCLELVSILSSHLSDRHHVRLEWMIIILIMVEVAFEVLHYIDRYLVK
ncbi:hypothetical protein PUN28_009015 [Cardiocondyla obscurior]|uniref:Glutathione synthetase n=2 Tax=Cardiocondyla obscurior TaxID=286306 RepID=A0AAW2FTF5_9HYME